MGIGRSFGSFSDKGNRSINEQDFRKMSWSKCQCSSSSQIPSQDDLNYHQFLSLYTLMRNHDKSELTIYNTENRKKDIKVLDTQAYLDESTCITQLPNGELFCYGSFKSGIALIIDRSYRVRILPSGTDCYWSSALYWDNNVYCFGGGNRAALTLSRRFDLEKNQWINLTPIPTADYYCHSVIYNRSILIAGYQSKNLWLYSIEIESFSIISYEFKSIIKVIINVGKFYLIEWGCNEFIYESEDEYNWKPISKSGKWYAGYPVYCLYNKEKIYISAWKGYCQFDLKKKCVLEIK